MSAREISLLLSTALASLMVGKARWIAYLIAPLRAGIRLLWVILLSLFITASLLHGAHLLDDALKLFFNIDFPE